MHVITPPRRPSPRPRRRGLYAAANRARRGRRLALVPNCGAEPVPAGARYPQLYHALARTSEARRYVLDRSIAGATNAGLRLADDVLAWIEQRTDAPLIAEEALLLAREVVRDGRHARDAPQGPAGRDARDRRPDGDDRAARGVRSVKNFDGAAGRASLLGYSTRRVWPPLF